MPDVVPVGRPVVHGNLKPVIVRATGAGCHFGYLVKRTPTTVTLTASRRLWKWSGAFTLSELAVSGPTLSGSRFGAGVDIVISGWHEIISCTPEAVKKIEAVGS